MKYLFIAIATTIACTLITDQVHAQEITTELTGDVSSFTLTISGLKKAEGEIRVAVFDSREHYTKETIHAVVLPVDSTTVSWSVPDLPYGEYAIAVYHDKNVNGELDTNLLGIPKEQYGFSNNARGRFGPASWDDARFEVNENQTDQHIEIK